MISRYFMKKLNQSVEHVLNEKFADILADAAWRIQQTWGQNQVPAEGLNIASHQLTGYVLRDEAGAGGTVSAGNNSIAWQDVYVVYQGKSFGPYPSPGGTWDSLAAPTAPNLGYVYWQAGTANSIAPNTTTTGSTNALPGSGTIAVTSTTGFSSSGQALIGTFLINYTGITGTSFTGVTSAQTATTAQMPAGSRVGQVGIVKTTTQPTLKRDDTLLFTNTAGFAKVAINPSGQPTGAQLLTGTVRSDQLAAGAVTTIKIEDDAINAAKIDNDAVGTDQLAPLAVTDAELANNAVINSKIQVGAVETDNLTIFNHLIF